MRHGEIWDVLEQEISRHKAGVIVTGTRGRRGLRKLVMGSVAEEILRLYPLPVLTVHPEAGQTSPPEPRTILFPTDFSADSIGYALWQHRNLRRACASAQRTTAATGYFAIEEISDNRCLTLRSCSLFNIVRPRGGPCGGARTVSTGQGASVTIL